MSLTRKWEDLFYYDETSPTFLRWKVVVRSGINEIRVLVSPGDVAGNVKNNGKASQVSVDGKNYFVHRILWEMFNDLEIPEGYVVDHKDGNPQNNRIENLRLVLQTINMRNQKKPSNNTSGVTGVSLMNTKGLQYWVASWRNLDGRLKQKCFSVAKHGFEKAKDLAANYREKMINSLNDNMAGYTERHGQ